MNVLNRELSNKTSNLVNSLLILFSRPVKFYSINHIFPPGSNVIPFGAADNSKLDAYYIYINTDLFGEPFETNLLHELFHVCQCEEGYPTTSTLVNNITKSKQPFFDHLGTLVISAILDLDVERRLSENDYSSSFFIKRRYDKIKKNLIIKYHDKYSFAELQALLLLFLLLADDNKRNLLSSMVKQQDEDFYKTLMHLSSEIKKLGYHDKYSSFASLNFLISQLDLWDVLIVNFDN